MRRGGGRQRQDGGPTERSADRSERQEVRPEVRTPRIDAMGLVDDEAVDVDLPERVEDLRHDELLGPQQDELDTAAADPRQRIATNCPTPDPS